MEILILDISWMESATEGAVSNKLMGRYSRSKSGGTINWSSDLI